MAQIVSYKGDPDDLLKEDVSGLINYLFGRDRTNVITKDDFIGFQQKLINDVLYLEYRRYDKEDKNIISELDFARNIIDNTNIPTKKKEKMLKRVEKQFGRNSLGITFEKYCLFYHLLFGGADLERAMFFLNKKSDAEGVDRKEFASIAKWVVGREMDSHVVELIFTLLDEDGDRHLSVKEFVPVMFQWRHSRGFQKNSVQVCLGQLKI